MKPKVVIGTFGLLSKSLDLALSLALGIPDVVALLSSFIFSSSFSSESEMTKSPCAGGPAGLFSLRPVSACLGPT